MRDEQLMDYYSSKNMACMQSVNAYKCILLFYTTFSYMLELLLKISLSCEDYPQNKSQIES